MQSIYETKSLTGREKEVLELVVEGFSAKEIALHLCIAPRTVECHIDHLRSKTRSRNRAQMVAVAVRTGLVPMTPQAA
ncbi:LuxR family transcriptional regulator [Sphingomonas koreensis]|nr:LuxR family transcriptional regulator [Sphingomonas koreensis]